MTRSPGSFGSIGVIQAMDIWACHWYHQHPMACYYDVLVSMRDQIDLFTTKSNRGRDLHQRRTDGVLPNDMKF